MPKGLVPIAPLRRGFLSCQVFRTKCNTFLRVESVYRAKQGLSIFNFRNVILYKLYFILSSYLVITPLSWTLSLPIARPDSVLCSELSSSVSYKGGRAKEILRKKHRLLFYLQPYSPQSNPIAHYWLVAKCRIQQWLD